jgi:hypothetical protein
MTLFVFIIAAISFIPIAASQYESASGSSVVQATPSITAPPLMALNSPVPRDPAGSSYQYRFIDNILAYSELPDCAREILGLAVKTMTWGCGDGSAMTSHDCFCCTTSSWTRMNNVIASHVFLGCDETVANVSTALADANSALAVFGTYCEQPQMIAIVTSAWNSTGWPFQCRRSV